jgi:hypothetical protein
MCDSKYIQSKLTNVSLLKMTLFNRKEFSTMITINTKAPAGRKMFVLVFYTKKKNNNVEIYHWPFKKKERNPKRSVCIL